MIKCRVLGPESMNKCLPKQLSGGCLRGHNIALPSPVGHTHPIVSQAWEHISFELPAPVHPRCLPHLVDTHLILGLMGSVSTAQMRHKPAKEA